MPRALTDIRVAHSQIGQGTASTTEVVEIDFDIGVREAIEIFGVYGLIRSGAVPAAAAGVEEYARQTLHLEDAAGVSTPGFTPTTADFLDLDSEIIFEQVKTVRNVLDTVNHKAAAGVLLIPNGLVTFPAPILSVVNVSHRAENDANNNNVMGVHIHYRYVSLTAEEVAFQFARRRR